ncbi:MAG: hypothetical protein WC903_03870 [Candidatus Margulisiibacteriota bacterium]
MFKQTIVAILLCQSILSPAAFALEITKKDSMSAALKSAVFPGWGQHENGESGKGINIISGDILMGGLYLKYSASVRDMESRNASVNDKWLDVTLRDYFLPDLLGNYFAGIVEGLRVTVGCPGRQLSLKSLLTSADFWIGSRVACS